MKKSSLIIVSLLSILFAGCFKEEATNDYGSLDTILIIPNANRPSNSPISLTTYAQTGGAKVFSLYGRVSSKNKLKTDLVVTYIKDQSAVSAYNTQFGTNYILMPDMGYSMPGLQLTIPANQIESYIPVTINPANLNPASNYMLAFTISDAQGKTISANYKTILLPIRIQ